MTTFKQYLDEIGACYTARQWSGDRTAKQAWEECPYAEWLLWWAARGGAPKEKIVLTACAIARTVVHLAKSPAALSAIEAAEKWAREPNADNLAAAKIARRAAEGEAAADTRVAAWAEATRAAAWAAASLFSASPWVAAARATWAATWAEATRAEAAADKPALVAIVRANLSQPWTE